MPQRPATTRASKGRRDRRLCSRNWTCFAFPRPLPLSTGLGSRHTGSCLPALPSFQRRAREHTRSRGWLQLTAPHCVQTQLRSFLQLQLTRGLACHKFGQVSAPFPHRGNAASSRAPRRAPACPALRSRTLQHCGPAGFSRDASKGRNQVSREGSRHVRGCSEELSRQCQELGQLLGSAAQPEENPAGKLRTWAAPAPGAAAPSQTFVCKPCGTSPCPGTSHRLCFSPSDIKQPAWRAGAGGPEKGLRGRRFSKENRTAVCGKGVPSTQGRWFWSGLV